MKIDSKELAGIISLCFELASDERVPKEIQKAFLYEGKRLRGIMVNIISAEFTGDDETFKKARAELTAVSDVVESYNQKLESAVAAVDGLGRLVGVLDGLLKNAVAFV